ncbi:MAG: hypothetical protein QXD36_06820 [Sulfolobales archaeon]
MVEVAKRRRIKLAVLVRTEIDEVRGKIMSLKEIGKKYPGLVRVLRANGIEPLGGVLLESEVETEERLRIICLESGENGKHKIMIYTLLYAD